ncbi:hydrophobic surface binding protein A domain-containing protein [Pochonia chlamydosporia 170]|uniref:Hydrophobic surface binding protein A domain-containing protein n=1 Tax=Pochonia chlamydosporia 170 TaxID=1380566 RepID=A0A179F5N5_METCM|nr:hydrophobic surface binding protein A domain-containing protein [Pochonia chlamydosporia 170]OAQ60429.1 hydrophobic surface binding protein A domain-containing protein [Pochonia chlamydosporia 170]
MRFFNFIIPFLATAVTANPVPRDVNSINAALDTISKQLVTMNTTLNGFNGGLQGTLTALKIQGQATDLQKAIQAATTAAKSSGPLNDQDSATVAFGITSLTGKIYDVLDNIVAKKPAFDKAILGVGSASFLVKSDLKGLKDATDTFGAALTDKFVKAVKDVSPLVISAIDFHFEQAQKVYA